MFVGFYPTPACPTFWHWRSQATNMYTVNNAMGFTAGAYNHFLRKNPPLLPVLKKSRFWGEPPSQNFTACGARRAVARIFDWRWSTCERSEHHSSVARSVTELWLWSASEVCASVPIELAGVWGRSPRKIFGKFYFLECIFTIEFTFYKDDWTSCSALVSLGQESIYYLVYLHYYTIPFVFVLRII